GATAGPDATGATLNANTSQAANGRIGVALALGAGLSFGSGSKKLVTLTFMLPANGTATSIPITFGDQPVKGEVVSATADVLQNTFTPGAVTVGKTVTSVSAATFAGGELASEQIAAAFGTELATTIQVATTIPLPTNLAGTTVKVK